MLTQSLFSLPNLTFTNGARIVFNFLEQGEKQLLSEKLSSLLISNHNPENSKDIRILDISGKRVFVLSINNLSIFFETKESSGFNILDITDKRILARFRNDLCD
jgi:hypothetical protein